MAINVFATLRFYRYMWTDQITQSAHACVLVPLYAILRIGNSSYPLRLFGDLTSVLVPIYSYSFIRIFLE